MYAASELLSLACDTHIYTVSRAKCMLGANLYVECEITRAVLALSASVNVGSQHVK